MTTSKSRAGISKALRWREVIVRMLRLGWDLPVRAQPRPKSFELVLADDLPMSHIEGLKHWSVICKFERSLRFSEGVDAALRAASADGKRYGVAIWPRRGAPLEDSYAVVRLGDWCDIAARLEEIEK